MAARLGNVLYWTGLVIAALVVAGGLFLSFAMVQESDAWFVRIITAISAALAWGVGRACRYVLAGT